MADFKGNNDYFGLGLFNNPSRSKTPEYLDLNFTGNLPGNNLYNYTGSNFDKQLATINNPTNAPYATPYVNPNNNVIDNYYASKYSPTNIGGGDGSGDGNKNGLGFFDPKNTNFGFNSNTFKFGLDALSGLSNLYFGLQGLNALKNQQEMMRENLTMAKKSHDLNVDTRAENRAAYGSWSADKKEAYKQKFSS